MAKTNYKYKPLPKWMRLDKRPMDEGEWQPYGYGYSRPVDPKRELWRPATRALIRRDKGKFKNYEMIELLPGAYYVSDHGRIFSRIKGRILQKGRKHKRHEKVWLIDERGKKIGTYRYRVALINFIEPPADIRNLVFYLCNTVNHRKGDAWKDNLDNLQFSPAWANTEHQHYVLQTGGPRKKREVIR